MIQKLLAQDINIGPSGASPVTLRGPLVGINNLSDVINKLLTFVVPIASIIVFFVFVWGGFDFLTSQGNPEKIKSGRAKITAGIIGFVLIVFALGFTKLIAFFLGLKNNGLF